MDKTIRQIVTLVGVLVVFTLVGYGASLYAPKIPRLTTTSSAALNQPMTAPTVTYQGEDGKTVLELLQRDHQVEAQDTSFGAFVSSVDGVPSTENAIWLYYIDGQQGVTPANETTTQAGQTIEWRYESF